MLGASPTGIQPFPIVSVNRHSGVRSFWEFICAIVRIYQENQQVLYPLTCGLTGPGFCPKINQRLVPCRALDPKIREKVTKSRISRNVVSLRDDCRYFVSN